MKKAKCIDASGFSLITKDKIYDVVSESRDFLYILNNSGVEKRYGKARFTILEPETTKPKIESRPKPVEVKPKGVICKVPKGSYFTYDNVYYPIGENKEEGKYIFLVNGKEESVLKSRFKPEV